MPSTFDPLLRVELQATGENENTWGDKANTGFELLAEAIAGHVSVAVGGSGDLTLSTANAAADEARMAFITLSGTITGTRNIIIPTASKIYYFRRNTSGAFDINIKTASGASATLPLTDGVAAVVCDGDDAWLLEDASKFPAVGGTITGEVEISVSTSTLGPAALTITQIGPGPAFVVEDVVNDTSPFIIKADGNVLIGTSTAYDIDAVTTAAVQVHRTNAAAAFMAGAWTNSVTGPQLELLKSRGAAVNTRGAVEEADTLGRLVFAGDDGTNFIAAAAILGRAAATVSASVVPGELLFQTAPASGVLTTRLTITELGNVGIGTTSPQELLHVNGTFRIGDAVVSTPVGDAPFQGCRAYISYAPSTATVKRAFNVASVVQNGTGDFTITFTTPLVGNSYIMLPWGNGASRTIGATIPSGLTAGSARVQFRYTDTNALQDPTEFHIAFIQ